MHETTPVIILLATFNGEKYLREQIDSVLAQSHKDWTLLIRDDGSSDHTVNIIEEYTPKYPFIHSIKRAENSERGVMENFNALLRKVSAYNAELIFFCDQDDVWHPNKIETFVTEYQHSANKNVPICLFSDLELIDKNGKSTARSFFQKSSITPLSNFKNKLVQNNITGCAMAINSVMYKKVKYVPEEALMHDYWFNLCSALIGNQIYINKTTMKYRHHDTNVVGSEKTWSPKRVYGKLFHDNLNSLSYESQAQQLQNWLKNENNKNDGKFNQEHVSQLMTFIDLHKKNRIQRLIGLYHQGFRPKGIAANMLFTFRQLTKK